MVYNAIAMYQEIRNNVKHRIFVTIGGQRVFFEQMTSYTIRYEVIYYPFPINSQYLKTWGLTALGKPPLTLV